MSIKSSKYFLNNRCESCCLYLMLLSFVAYTSCNWNKFFNLHFPTNLCLVLIHTELD